MALRIVSLGRGSGVMGTLSARGSCDGDQGIVCLVLMGVVGGGGGVMGAYVPNQCDKKNCFSTDSSVELVLVLIISRRQFWGRHWI